jgi:hypothetical protein
MRKFTEMNWMLNGMISQEYVKYTEICFTIKIKIQTLMANDFVNMWDFIKLEIFKKNTGGWKKVT